MEDTSPAKWHLAHVSWFEGFILKEYIDSYVEFDHNFRFLFNSYYETVGKMQKRSQRYLIAKPSVSRVYEYRNHINNFVLENLEVIVKNKEALKRLEIGLNHEQQHTELLVTDLKYNIYEPYQESAHDKENTVKSSELNLLAGRH